MLYPLNVVPAVEDGGYLKGMATLAANVGAVNPQKSKAGKKRSQKKQQLQERAQRFKKE
jgi:hypothetical protein